MITKALLLKLFDATYIQRWNDKLRPVDLYELDKQSHKMIIAYILGKHEEQQESFDWIEIIEGGIFELLQRIVLTDIKPPVFYKIKEDKAKYKELNKWVYKRLESVIAPLGKEFCSRFLRYFSQDEQNINKKVLSAAHFTATSWEFNILENANPHGYEMKIIRNRILEQREANTNLAGMQNNALGTLDSFINLCGEMRFQTRWSNIYRIPKTSVLSHMLFVAMLSYLFSLELGACKQRCINNYFTGLFHDLPESLTRDIISPVKSSIPGLDKMIKDIEKEFMEKGIYNLLPEEWVSEIRFYTENEFTDSVLVDNQRKEASFQQINDQYNSDGYSPRDGALIKAADNMAAFIEAYEGIRNGSASEVLYETKINIKEKYRYSNIGEFKLGSIYEDFD
jgi:putative hydrolases of HD superfamily